MGCICNNKKEQSPIKPTQSIQLTSTQLLVLVETKFYKFYRSHQQLQNITNSTILKRRRRMLKIIDQNS